MGAAIANGLVDIADALPRVELASSLYPTASIKQTAAVLYAHIIRFLLRALEWYEHGAWKRALHSVSKPAPLRYGDIFEDIRRVTESIDAHAVASSQAEQRDMHKELVSIRRIVETGHETNAIEQKHLRQKLERLFDLISELKTLTVSEQANAHTQRAQIHRSLCSIQSAQALHIISSQCHIDHHESLHASRVLRNRRRLTADTKCAPFWDSSGLQAWNQSSASSLMSIKVPFSSRRPVQDFCTNVIEQLCHAQIAVLWVLKSKDDTYSVPATLKSLIRQAATYIYQSQPESKPSWQLDRFLHAQFEDHYLDVLIDLICHLKVVYITVQLEAIQSVSAGHFMTCLQRLIERLSSHGARTVVRILVLTWVPGRSMKDEGRQTQHPKLHVQQVSRRKRARLPNRPLAAK